MEYPVRVISSEDSRGHFVLIPKFQDDLFLTMGELILEMKCEKHNLRKS